MALHTKALNNDTTFLLTFIPSICPADQKFPETFPGAFTVLIDPRVASGADILGPKYSRANRSLIASLNDVPEPDVILISQAHPDHCHEDSLCQLSPHIQSMIVGEPAAIKKIKRWRHFDHGNISSLKRYKRGRDDTLFRVEIPPPSPLGTPGELTIALLAPKPDFSGGLHNTIGITYREPSSILSRSRAMIQTPPMSRASNSKPPTSASSIVTSDFASEYAGCERTISVLYTPHGVPYEVIEPWVSGHLAPESALPPLAMIHSTAVVEGSWYAGGNMAAGCPGGLEIARRLLPTVWIAAHDEDGKCASAAGKSFSRIEYDIMDAQTQLWEDLIRQKQRRKPQILRLEAGETLRVDEIGANMVMEPTTQTVKEEKEEETAPPRKEHGEDDLTSMSSVPPVEVHDPI